MPGGAPSARQRRRTSSTVSSGGLGFAAPGRKATGTPRGTSPLRAPTIEDGSPPPKGGNPHRARQRRRPHGRASGPARSPSSWPRSRARSWARWPRRTAPSRRPSRARSTSARRAPTSSATSRGGSRASSGWRGSSSKRASCARRTSTRRPSWRSRSTPCSSRRRSSGGWSSTTTASASTRSCGRCRRPTEAPSWPLFPTDWRGASNWSPRPSSVWSRCGAPTRRASSAGHRRASGRTPSGAGRKRRTTGNRIWSPVSGGAGTGSRP